MKQASAIIFAALVFLHGSLVVADNNNVWFRSAEGVIFSDGFESGDASMWSVCSGCLIFYDGFETGNPNEWSAVVGYIPPAPYYRLTSAQWSIGTLVIYGEGVSPEYLSAYTYSSAPYWLDVLSCVDSSIVTTGDGLWRAILEDCTLGVPLMVYAWTVHYGIPHSEGGAVRGYPSGQPPSWWHPRLY